jgi:hypothetical protein
MEENPASPNSERLRILRMLEEKKISAEEAAGLLSALNGEPEESAPQEALPASSPRWFRVRVTDTFTGQPRASVSLPYRLMEWGLSLGAEFTPQVAGIKVRELRDLLSSGVDGKIIDVLDEEDGERVEIFVE